MRVRLRAESRGLGTVVGGPMRRKAEEESLVEREAVNGRRRRFSGQRFLKRRVGDHQAAKVGDALAFLEFSVAVQARLDFERIELLGDAIAARAEILQVLRRPPALQVAVRVELRALIVEAVRHLMADHGADAAVVERVIRFGVEKRRLENSRGENDFVVQRRVVGVDRRRRHSPFGAVHGLADLGEVARGFKRIAARDIFHVRAAVHLERGIVAPFVRVADLQIHGVELVDGLRARLRAHPIERGKILAQRGH